MRNDSVKLTLLCLSCAYLGALGNRGQSILSLWVIVKFITQKSPYSFETIIAFCKSRSVT